jgi:hypothetical protein
MEEVVVAVVFMAVVAACTPVEEAGPAEGRIQGLRPVIEVHLLVRLPLPVRVTAIIPGLAVISRVGLNVMEIPRRVHLRLLMGSGIPLPGQPETVDRQARHPAQEPLVALAASTYLARIAETGRAAPFAAFRGRAAKSGKILPALEMLCPNLNRFPRFTIRSAAQPVSTPDSGQTRRFPHLHVSLAQRRSRATEHFRAD